MAHVKLNGNPKENLSKKDRNTFNTIRSVLVFFYFIVVPYCQAPGWCLDYYHARNERHFGMFDCDTASAESRIRYSAFPTFSPLLTVIIDVLCLGGFIGMSIMERKWKEVTKGERRRTGLLYIAVLISVIDLTRAFFAMKSTFFANLMRVVILLTFSTELR